MSLEINNVGMDGDKERSGGDGWWGGGMNLIGVLMMIITIRIKFTISRTAVNSIFTASRSIVPLPPLLSQSVSQSVRLLAERKTYFTI